MCIMVRSATILLMRNRRWASLLVGIFGLGGLVGCLPAPTRTPPHQVVALPEPPTGPSGQPMIHPPHDHGPRPIGTKDAPVAILSDDQPPQQGMRLTCPVCGDEFSVEEKLPMRLYKGKVFIFCCERCLPHFDKNPDLFLNQ